MILVISHFTSNKGTTDYFVDYLKQRSLPFYYLRHPFVFTPENKSELIYFDGKNTKIVASFQKSKNEPVDLLRNLFLTAYLSFKLGKKIDKVFAFGSFNFIPFLFCNFILKRKIYFWGCDYSRKRFGNSLLNKIYLSIETIACKRAFKVIQPTKRQEEARLKYHSLKLQKSIIVPNGINFINANNEANNADISFIYIGSITQQHGIIDFIKHFYVNKKINNKLYIFGGGEKANELEQVLKEEDAKNVFYFGTNTADQIIQFINSKKSRLFGIAPYDFSGSDHVYYGDSLKLKEYLNYNLPYITPEKTYIPENLKTFGLTYRDFSDLAKKMPNLQKFHFSISQKNKILVDYDWNKVFDLLLPEIK